MTTNQEGVFVLPAKNPGEAHTLIVGQAAKGKSMMPDNSELTMELASKAFQMLGRDRFEVSANLSVDNLDTLRNFGQFQSILLMAFNQGLAQAKDVIVRKASAGDKWLSEDAASQCLDAIDGCIQLGANEPL